MIDGYAGPVVTPTAVRSLTERVYHELRADILACTLRPGNRLRPGEIAQEVGVSLNVVREALNRLAGEGLVRASAQLGFTVAELSIVDLNDLTGLRTIVECSAIRASVELGSLEWETGVVAAHHLLAGTPIVDSEAPDQIRADWMDAHNAFHAATMSGCGNQRLVQLTATLGSAAGIYRHWSQAYDHGERDIAGEHRAIFTAVLARNAEAACLAHSDHIRRTAHIVTAAIKARE